MRYLFLSLSLLIISLAPLSATPFGNLEDKNETQQKAEKEKQALKRQQAVETKTEDESLFARTRSKIIALQAKFVESITTAMQAQKSGTNLRWVAILLGLSFAYGVIHALGPGHGKSLLSAYFVANEGSAAKGLLAVGILTLTHSMVSLAIVAVLNLVLSVSQTRSLPIVENSLRLVSGLIVASYAALHLLRSLGVLKKKAHHHHHHSETASSRELISISFSIGLVPCPGIFLILLYASQAGTLFWGLLAALSLTIGMALTLYSISMIVIFSRSKGSQSAGGWLKPKYLSRLGNSILLFLGVSLIVLAVNALV